MYAEVVGGAGAGGGRGARVAFKQVFGQSSAGTASRTEAECRGQIADVGGAFLYGRKDVIFCNCVANADVHGVFCDFLTQPEV